MLQRAADPEDALPAAARRRSRSSRRSSSPSASCSRPARRSASRSIPDARTTFWLALPLARPVRRALAGVALALACAERRLPRRRAPGRGAAAAVVLPDADPLLVLAVPGPRPHPDAGAPLREPDHAADRGDPRRRCARADCRAPATWSISSSLRSSRSRSARWSSRASTTGSRSSSDDDPSVVEPRLAARVRERGQAFDLRPAQRTARCRARATGRAADARSPERARRPARHGSSAFGGRAGRRARSTPATTA